MSVYPAPSRYPSIFNPALFWSYTSGTLTSAQADATYAKLAGGQTIVAQETFAGGILTNTVGLASGSQLTVNATDTVFNGTVSGTELSADTLLSAPSTTTNALNVTGTASIPSLTLTSGMTMGSITTLFAASFGTSATTHTITSTQLSWLGNTGWNGELKIFADDQGTNGAVSVVYLHKPGSTLSVIQGARSTSTTINTTVASNTSITVTLSVSCRICWIFMGAT